MHQQTQWMLGLAVIAAVAMAPVRAPAQVQTGDPPNPYRTVENWAKLPDARKWGQTIGVDIDPDGKSIWVFERCGGTTCDGSGVAPILKIDPSGNVVKSFGADMFVFPTVSTSTATAMSGSPTDAAKGARATRRSSSAPTARC
jgi:hypothetical protein